ncbi:MAG: hypothetical protein IPJ74_24860 [Saprospiraceae bacterium]|nr:hypothetical protein [Saprospiraceae bacterium]
MCIVIACINLTDFKAKILDNKRNGLAFGYQWSGLPTGRLIGEFLNAYKFVGGVRGGAATGARKKKKF